MTCFWYKEFDLSPICVTTMIENCFNSLNGKVTQRVNFTLKGKEDKLQQIYLNLSINKKRLRWYIGERIYPIYWDANACRAIINNTFTRRQNAANRQVNAIIERTLLKIDEFVHKFDYSEEDDISLNFTVEALRRFLDDDDTYSNPLNYFRNLVDTITQKVNKKTNLNNTISTKKSYNSVLKRLEDFYTAYGYKSDWNFFGEKFEKDFRTYLTTGKRYSFNTVQYTFQVLRIWLNEAYREGYIKNDKFRTFHCTPKTDNDSIYLNFEELDKLFNLDLSVTPKLAISRDLFIVGSFTGLRWSDYSKLNAIRSEDTFISVVTEKTKKKVQIPISRYIRTILERYNYELPKAFSTPVTIEHLQKICKMAEIDEEVKTSEIKAGEMIEMVSPKYELCGTHTARRSFCTNFYLLGVDVVTLMAMSGHSSQEQFFKYIKVTQEQQANIFLEKMKEADLV